MAHNVRVCDVWQPAPSLSTEAERYFETQTTNYYEPSQWHMHIVSGLAGPRCL